MILHRVKVPARVSGITPVCWFCNKELQQGIWSDQSAMEFLGNCKCNDCGVNYYWNKEGEWKVHTINFFIKDQVLFYLSFQGEFARLNHLPGMGGARTLVHFKNIYPLLSLPIDKLKSKLLRLLAFA